MNQVADRLVVVATFLEPNQAHLARSKLETEGIWSALDGEYHVAMNWLISNAIGGVKLLVSERDVEAAQRILDRKSGGFTSDDAGRATDTEAPVEKCPVCDSDDIYRERIKRRLVFLSLLFLGIPIPFVSRKMVCENCGHRWIPR